MLLEYDVMEMEFGYDVYTMLLGFPKMRSLPQLSKNVCIMLESVYISNNWGLLAFEIFNIEQAAKL